MSCFPLRLVERLKGSFEPFPQGRHGCRHLNGVAWTKPTVAGLPAHSGHFVIAVQGAIVDFSTVPFIQDKSAIQC